VRFAWDRADPSFWGSDPTCWLRVSQTWAGATSPAFLFIPRVGMEVVVSFIDGDPDRPLVTGCVYNGDNAAPAMLPLQATKSVIRTRSVPFGTGYNELSFEDAIGMERVYLRAERDLSELVQNDHEARVGGNEIVTVGGVQTNMVGFDQQVSVGRHYRHAVGGDRQEMTERNVRRTAGGSVDESVYGTYSLLVGGGVSVRAPQGELVANTARGIALESGSSVLRMTDKEEIDTYEKDKGMTLTSFGSTIHLTQDRVEICVGGSSLVITPQMIQANGKTFPATGNPPPQEPPAE
jgi:type VI secretion system secreted protein VgrG